MAVSRARLQQLLAPVVEAAGAELDDVSATPAGRRSVVRVVVDKDGGVDLDAVAEVSRAVSEALDALDAAEPGALGASYVLEVTSPGVDRPLTEPRHWRRATGRLVAAVLADGTTTTGRVSRADDGRDGVAVLDVDGTEVPVPYAEVVRARVQVEFSRPGGSAADDDSDDDDGDDGGDDDDDTGRDLDDEPEHEEEGT